MRSVNPLRRTSRCAPILLLAFFQVPWASVLLAQGDSLKAEDQKPSTSGFRQVAGRVPDDESLTTPELDRAVASGLKWLAERQNDNGTFGVGPHRANLAVTGLAGLAFMASGSSPGAGPYGEQIDKAINRILRKAGSSGLFQSGEPRAAGAPMYDHGFATLFLSEAQAAAPRAEMNDALAKAVQLLADVQNDEGGWRYQPRKADADVSVTVCQLNALRAASLAGIEVPRETVKAAQSYVKTRQGADGGFNYTTNTATVSAFPRSAACLDVLLNAADRDEKAIDKGMAYLKLKTPSWRVDRPPHYHYGRYYATQVMWLRGGDDWKQWFTAARDELIGLQSPEGNWTESFSEEYATAMALIILQTPKNHLRSFQR